MDTRLLARLGDKMNFETILAAAVVASLGASGPVLAETKTTVTKVTETTTYQESDLDANGALGPGEFTTYVYNRWDRDNDGFLSDEEWELSAVDWYRPYDAEYKTYTFWDKDSDGRLDENEFRTLISQTELYNRWDINRNNVLEKDEYAAATFSLYDENNDGEIDLEEWKQSLL